MSYCRKCGSPSVWSLVRRNALERLLSVISRLHRCEDCGHEFHVLKWSHPDSAGARELRWYPPNPRAPCVGIHLIRKHQKHQEARKRDRNITDLLHKMLVYLELWLFCAWLSWREDRRNTRASRTKVNLAARPVCPIRIIPTESHRRGVPDLATHHFHSLSRRQLQRLAIRTPAVNSRLRNNEIE